MSGQAQGERISGMGLGTRWLLAGVAAIGLCAGGAAFWLAERGRVAARHPQIEGRLEVAGAAAPIRILRDRGGVPHVRAESADDAWFGLGFVHAQDRLGQMLSARRAAWGRRAEVEGASALEADRWARVIGFGRLALAETERLGRAEREVLEAYAQGVNAWLARVRAGMVGRPAGITGDDPLDPWSVTDSLALAKARAWTLGATVEESLTLEALIRRLGPSHSGAFFPKTPRRVGFRPEGPAVVAWRDPLRRHAGHQGRGIGSSAILVSRGLARRGAPLLAADAHYPALAPAELHQAELRGGALSVAGAAVPGLPVFWTGFTPRVVWAVSHAPVVVTDLVVETLHASGRDLSFEGRSWKDLAIEEETIEVRGAPPELLRIRSTPRGPLVHELLGSTVPLSVQWMGASKGAPLRGFLGLLAADGAGEAREALRSHTEPVVAVLAADRRDGFYQLAGRIPDRDLASGLVPLPSSNPGYRWKGALDQDELPHRSLGGRRPWLVAADERPGSTGAIETLWRAGDRSDRWKEALRELRSKGRMDEGDLVGLHGDARSDRARQWVEHTLAIARATPLRSREARDVVALLEGWDGDMAAPRSQAAAYHVFVSRLLRHLFEPELGEELLERLLALRGMEPSWLLRLAFEGERDASGRAPSWSDPARVTQAVHRSLRETWIELAVTLGPNRKKWGWGRLHPLRFRSRAPVGWRADPALGPFPFGGDGTTLQFGEYQPLRSYESHIVAVQRMIADASDLDQALVFLAPGQVEQAGHRWHADGVARWLEGKPALLSTRDPVVADALVAELRLEPAP